MPTYRIRFEQIEEYEIEIEAENREDAIDEVEMGVDVSEAKHKGTLTTEVTDCDLL